MNFSERQDNDNWIVKTMLAMRIATRVTYGRDYYGKLSTVYFNFWHPLVWVLFIIGASVSAIEAVIDFTKNEIRAYQDSKRLIHKYAKQIRQRKRKDKQGD